MRPITYLAILMLLTGTAHASNDNQIDLQDLLRELQTLKSEQDRMKSKMGEMEEELKMYRATSPAPHAGSGPVVEDTATPPSPEKQGLLERRVKKLEDMAGKTFSLEPMSGIEKVTEWACPNGHLYDHPMPNHVCPICGRPQTERVAYRKQKYARKKTVSGLIGTMMEKMLEKRVSVGLSSTGVVQQTINSTKGKNDTTTAQGSFDLFFLHKPMENSILFVNLESIGGSGPNIFSGTPNNMNDDVSRGSHQDTDGLDRVSVREVWLQSMLMEDRLRLVAGKLDLANYFDMNAVANDETTQFLSSAFVNNLALSAPGNSPGVVSYFNAEKGFSFGLGAQSNDNSGAAVTDRLFAVGEIDYSNPEFLFGREGNYRFWGRYNAADRGRAFGISFDQKFTDRLTAFSRFGITGNTAPEEVEWTWSLGLGMESPFSFRKKDQTGLAFSQIKMPGGKKEDFMEAYYNMFITDHMSLSLDSQVFINSIGDPEDTAVDEDLLSAFGLRVQMDF